MAGMVISVLGASLGTVLLWRVWDQLVILFLSFLLLFFGSWRVDGFIKGPTPLRNWIIVWGVVVGIFAFNFYVPLTSEVRDIVTCVVYWLWAAQNCWSAWKQLTPPKPKPPDGLSPDLTHP